MAVAAPHDAGLRPMAAQALGHMPDDGAHLAALGVRAGRRIAATGVPLATYDVQRRKTTLVVMRVPECKLLAMAAQNVSSMSRTSSLPGFTVVPS